MDEGAEVDFGDSGIGVTFATARSARRCRARAAVVFARPRREHFDERTDGWAEAAAARVVSALAAGR